MEDWRTKIKDKESNRTRKENEGKEYKKPSLKKKWLKNMLKILKIEKKDI